ncbi:ATP-binding protein [Occallatibacter savannae]|uniref:ATP-binding protein n=1 Tax=Occallatibacter savannae TaxID=1002691 RepID=UPI0013A599EF
MKTVTVQVQADHLKSLAKKRPLSALAELIWNGLDADADEIQVVFQKNDIEGLTRVIVRDDGHGLP